MKKFLAIIYLIGLLLIAPTITYATLLDFEDFIFNHDTEIISLVGNYGGLTWSGTKLFDPSAYDANTGRWVEAASGVTVALNTPSMTIASDSPFDFIGAYFASGESVDVALQVAAFLNNSPQYTQVYTLPHGDAMKFYTFNFDGIDKLVFTCSFSPNIRASFTMDDFTYHVSNTVPEPAALFLLASGLVGLLAGRRMLKL